MSVVRVVVLIPAFNAHDELQRTLGSLALDPFPFDILVVDDGSEPPLDVPDAAGEHRILIERLPSNRGVAHALNAGMRWILEREYDVVVRVDAGDMNEPTRVTRQVRFLEQHPGVAMVGSWTRHLDDRLQPLYVTRFPATWQAIQRCFHYRTAFSHVACTIRTSVLRTVGAYDEAYPLGEDYELFWRLAAQYPCANIPEVLVTRVESRVSLTHTNRLAMARMRLLLQWRHFAWRRIDSWLGVARSLGLLLLPAGVALSLKRAAGTIG
jgi:GT2 family glycosyltransferase